MKFLVFSDSHGSSTNMQRILKKQLPTLSGALHLGDGTEEFSLLFSLPGCERLIFASVCGNGEQFSLPSALRPPLMRILTVEGVRVLLTHGHQEHVSFGVSRLAEVARQNNCTLALHGHTHIPTHKIDRGEDEKQSAVEILCPGSIARPRAGGCSYGIIELKNQQILAYHTEV